MMRKQDEQDLLLYKQLYLRLFNAVTDAITLLDGGAGKQAKGLLVFAQQACEELYIGAEEEDSMP